MNTAYILLKITHTKPDPDLTDKVAGRAWTMDGVEGVTASKIEEKDIPEQLKENLK